MINRRVVWLVVGTRPECIKQAPLYAALVQRLGAAAVRLIGTGQHRELLDQALDAFGVRLDDAFSVMQPGQSLNLIAARILEGFESLLEPGLPTLVVVQGDTTTAAAAAMAAHYRGVRVAHNEAGLRTYDLSQPFPEEGNRRIITAITHLHFAPTNRARENLLTEGVPSERVHVTGNTGIDALRWALVRPPSPVLAALKKRMTSVAPAGYCLVTAHRRENQGSGMAQWFSALREFLDSAPGFGLVYVQHPNGFANEAWHVCLGDREARACVVEPLPYVDLCHLLVGCRFVVTDSGGLQEEGATLRIPVIVCRAVTERPEAMAAGLARLTGTDIPAILDGMNWARQMAPPPSDVDWDSGPFGDGRAAARIAEIVAREIAG